MIKFLLVAIAIHGYIANIANQKIKSYILWMASNTGWAIYNYSVKEYALMSMFLVYNMFCLYGIIRENKCKQYILKNQNQSTIH